MNNVLSFKKSKIQGSKISMVTCYDYTSARILNESNIDCILVGDSAAMVMHGHTSTINADVDMMKAMVRAVRVGAPDKFIIGDMPFLSFRRGVQRGVEVAGELMRAGANAVKLEGIEGHEDLVKYLVESGIPVMGHLGLTPQSVNQLGGHKVQGREEKGAKKMIEAGKLLEQLGCFAIVLECIPSEVAKLMTSELSIATIGIGAGNTTDGQVLVMQDMLGMTKEFKPKFLRKYIEGHELFLSAFNQFDKDVKINSFPNESESY